MTLTGEHVLVTGGAGFVGSHVTTELLTHNADVSVLDNTFAGERDHVPDGVEFYDIDIRDQGAVTRAVQEINPSVIIHLAAIHYIPYCNENPEEAFDVNVIGTRNLLEAARELTNLEKLVYTSTAAVYPPRDEAHSETDAEEPMDIYGRTKLVGEDLVKLFAMETGVPSVSARLFNIYGENETNPHLIPAIVEQLDAEADEHDVELGNLSPKRDFIYVEDVANALVTLAIEFEGEYRAYNVGTGRSHSVRTVVEKVEAALDEKINLQQDEERVRESDRPNLRADTNRIRQETSWTPRTEFVDGLGRLLEERGLK